MSKTKIEAVLVTPYGAQVVRVTEGVKMVDVPFATGGGLFRKTYDVVLNDGGVYTLEPHAACPQKEE